MVIPRGEPRLELGVQRFWNFVELFWNSLDNAPSTIVFYLEMKVEVEVGVHDIRSRFTPRVILIERAFRKELPILYKKYLVTSTILKQVE